MYRCVCRLLISVRAAVLVVFCTVIGLVAERAARRDVNVRRK